MPVQQGDTGKVAVGTLKTFNISVAAARETLLGTPVASLPTANPGTPQMTYTIQSSDLPIVTPSPLSVKYSAYLITSGKNTDAATQTLNYQCYKNGIAISGATGSQSINTNLFWTLSHYRWTDISVGDVIGVSLWTASANINYDYYAVIVYPTKLELTKAPLVKDLNLTLGSSPSLTQGNPIIALTGGWNVYPSSNASYPATPIANVTIPFISMPLSLNGSGAGRINNGDHTLSTGPQTHSSGHPYYYKSNYPSQVTFREMR
jgi:hypothetical protein